jgi:hypothetical protein
VIPLALSVQYLIFLTKKENNKCQPNLEFPNCSSYWLPSSRSSGLEESERLPANWAKRYALSKMAFEEIKKEESKIENGTKEELVQERNSGEPR